MGLFLVYMFKSAICLTLLYLLYSLLMSKETFHRTNRIAILAILVLSIVIPFIQIKVENQTDVQETFLTLEQLILLASQNETGEEVSQRTTLTPLHFVLLIYLLGLVFFIVRHVYSFIKLQLLLRSGERETINNNTQLIIHDQALAPFSWMNYIVISRTDLEENGREILIHEQAHIRHRHTIDLLVMDIYLYLQWFNPTAWLLKKEMQNVHEFEADETVINEGVDAKQYQLLLIKKAVGTRLYSMANSFNHSKLKKRITMMSKQKSSKWAYLKYLYILPAVAISVIAFARPEVSAELKELSETKVSDFTDIIVPVEAESPQGVKTDKKEKKVPPPPTKSVKKETKVAEEQPTEQKNEKPIKVIITETETTGGSSVTKSTSVNITDNKTDHNTLYITGDSMTVNTYDFSKDGKQPLIVINDEIVSHSILHAIDHTKIENVTVLKGQSATDAYGEQGENGVIKITINDGNNTVKMKRKNITMKMDTNVSLTGDSTKQYRVFLNGKEVSKDELNRLNKEGTKTIQVTEGKADGKEKFLFIETHQVNPGDLIKVNGQVIDVKGKAIVGATVMVEGTTAGNVTDVEGRFQMKVPKGSILRVGFIDYDTVTTEAKEEMRVILNKE